MSLLNLHTTKNKIKNMTNTIQFTSNSLKAVFDKTYVSKQSSSIASTSFNDMFSTLISDANSISSLNDANGLSNDFLSPILLMMFNQLFGNDISFDTINASSPEGAPVNGALTQTSHEGHVALDFGIPIGTDVKTTMEGKITFAGWNNEGYGNLVIVENGAYKTYYAHLSNIPVNVGQSVKTGDVIGLSGNTGNSTGPHLHYEIRKNGIAINPITSLNS
ncbi:MAG: peptidase, M23/M37 family protein [uncultured bacterium]|nr:MAG: peptidase, M23/M37 family protein [uncultured bacterium]